MAIIRDNGMEERYFKLIADLQQANNTITILQDKLNMLYQLIYGKNMDDFFNYMVDYNNPLNNKIERLANINTILINRTVNDSINNSLINYYFLNQSDYNLSFENEEEINQYFSNKFDYDITFTFGNTASESIGRIDVFDLKVKNKKDYNLNFSNTFELSAWRDIIVKIPNKPLHSNDISYLMIETTFKINEERLDKELKSIIFDLEMKKGSKNNAS